ncbi:hypothetical protein ABDJ41_18605 [Pedobacter sp. ASV1-7]|uniref:hypothetical protein n=1 Tax=Pedobacter sp. ASV1-7 TaxID=3145237 RepID=UPI0032E8DAEF
MKKLLFGITLLVMTVNFSCKKDNDEAGEKPKTIEVEYKIDRPNPYFVEISYSNEANNMITLRDITELSNGSKTISITKRPYTAKLTTILNNTSNQKINYNLIILVDGEIKKVSPVDAPPGVNGVTSTVQFTID